MRDEYLLLKQAAYLIGVTKQTFEYYIKKGKIKTELNRGNRMVKVSALALFVNEQLKKYDLAKQYFEADSKWAFWKLQPKKFNTTNRIVEDSMIEYLTLQQTAYLLGLSAYNIRYLISKDVFHAVIDVRGKRTLYFIRADEIWCYVTEQMCQYSKAIEYFQCENSYAFWQKYEDDFKTNWINTKKGINATMAKRKFKNQLVEQMKQEEREKEHQESLKERYDIEEDVVVVEKNNTIKFLLKTMIGGARLIIAILVFILALIGLTALIYPDSRSLLIRQGLQVWQEFMRLL